MWFQDTFVSPHFTASPMHLKDNDNVQNKEHDCIHGVHTSRNLYRTRNILCTCVHFLLMSSLAKSASQWLLASQAKLSILYMRVQMQWCWPLQKGFLDETMWFSSWQLDSVLLEYLLWWFSEELVGPWKFEHLLCILAMDHSNQLCLP